MISSDSNFQIPVRDVQLQQPSDNQHAAVIPEELLVQKERSNAIETALSRFRSGVERVYSESKERSLGRLRESEDEMSRRFQISTVQNNDTSELQKLDGNSMSRLMSGGENQNILEEASKLDCYVIREQIKSSQNREEEEERVYREEIEKLKRKNVELEQRIKQKKRLNAMDQMSSISNKAINISSNSTVRLPTAAGAAHTSSLSSAAIKPVGLNIGQTPATLTPFPSAAFKAATTLDAVVPPMLAGTSNLKQKTGSQNVLDFGDFQFPAVASTNESAVPEVQVIFEGKQRDLGRCLRKFAKKIFYLQKHCEKVEHERNKWKTDFEVLDKSTKDVAVKYDESIEIAKLNDKKLQEIRIEAERHRTLAVSLEEELNKTRNQPTAEPEVQIIEKIIEKPIEIIKHIILEKIVEKPIEIIKTIEVPPIENEKFIEKIVEVPVEKIIEKIVHVPHEVIIEKIVEVPKIEIVEREKIVEVPRIEYVEKVVYVDKPVYLDKPNVTVTKEIIDSSNPGAERELNFLRDDYRKLQLAHDGLMRTVDEYKIRLIQQEEVMHHADVDRSIHYEHDRNALVEEIKNNHITIDDLRARIELLYKEITTLSESNNRKNLDMTNQIRLLEDQLALYCAPRVLTTVVAQPPPQSYPVTFQTTHHYEQQSQVPVTTHHVSSQSYYKNNHSSSVQNLSQPLRDNNYYYQQTSTNTVNNHVNNQQNQQKHSISNAQVTQSQMINNSASSNKGNATNNNGGWNENANAGGGGGVRYQM